MKVTQDQLLEAADILIDAIRSEVHDFIHELWMVMDASEEEVDDSGA